MSELPRALAIGAGVSALVLIGAKAWSVLKGTVLPSSSSDTEDLKIESIAPAPAVAAAHRAARPILLEAFQNVMGRKPSLRELQYAHAIAWLETSYGRGWKGEMQNANNWGAVQCPLNAQDGPNCVPYEDSYSSGAKYKVSFRRYPTPVAGAEDVIRHIFKLRPITAASLANGEDDFHASYAMRREKYYGGFCPLATAKYGIADANASLGHPDKNEGTQACEAEAVGLHARRAHLISQNVAASLGESVAAPLGVYEKADQDYKKHHTLMAGRPFAQGGVVRITPSFGLGALAMNLGVSHEEAYRIAGLDLVGGYPWA